MRPSAQADQLIRELLAEPRYFADSGRGYKLLQTYFKGAPLDTLRPLLRSQELLVQRVAASVVSELGAQGSELLDEVLPLMDSGDRSLTFDAMESVAVCATGVKAPEYLRVVTKLGDPDQAVRWLSMFLMSNAEASQLEAARARVEEGADREHRQGLQLLLDASVSDEEVLAFIHSDQPLRRRYGAVAAGRLYEKSPRLIDEAEAVADDDVVSFVRAFRKSRRRVTPAHESDR